MQSAPNIYLIGPMGSGKTTIGQRVAKRLKMDFLDCDRELEKQTGASVSLIFDMEGESGFRDRESRLFADLSTRKNVLIATGGGVILRSENKQLLKRTGFVVYMQTSVDQQLSRLRLDRSRPLLQDGDRKEKLCRLAEARNPVYEDLADLVFPSRNRGPDAAAGMLAAAIESRLSQGAQPVQESTQAGEYGTSEKGEL